VGEQYNGKYGHHKGHLMPEQRPAARILIADANQLLAEACKSLLEPEFSVVGIVTDGRHLADAVAELRPDIMILDIYMTRLNRLDSSSRPKRKTPGIKLVFRTITLAADEATASHRDAPGYALEQSAENELLLAVRKVNRGEAHLSPHVARETVTFPLIKGDHSIEEKRITKRQSEILQLLAEGLSMKQVAGVIDVKPGTVAFHKYRMMETLNIRTNAELLGYAIKHQMISM
jgi:DNA-binding NarL/FixJ family response regulator